MRREFVDKYSSLNWPICLFLFCLFPLAAISQRLPSPDILTTEDGLGFRNIRSIAQDKNGLMWFGTTSGLNRFDGYRFIEFGQDADRPFPAEDFLRNALFVHEDSTLWVVGDNQLFSINPLNFSVDKIDGVEGNIWKMQAGKFGDTWLVSDTKDKSQQVLWRHTSKEGFKKIATVQRGRREFSDLAIDTLGQAWWTTINYGIQAYGLDGTLLHEVKLDSFIWFGTKMFFSPLFVNSQNRIFIFPKSKNEVWEYSPSTGRIEIILSGLATPVYTASEDSRGNVWFATKKEAYQMSPEGTVINHSTRFNQALDFSEINAFYEDPKSVFWVGTDGGLMRIPVQKHLFQNHLSQLGVGWGNSMRGIFESQDGRIYFTVESGAPGFYEHNPTNQETHQLEFPPSESENLEKLEGANNMVYLPEQNSIWTYNYKLYKIDLSSKKIYSFADKSLVGVSTIYSPITWLPNNNLLVGNDLGHLAFFDPYEEVFENLDIRSDLDLNKISTKCFLPADDSHFWVGTPKHGLFHIDSSGTILQRWTTLTQPGLNNDHILCLYHDKGSQDLWVGTFGGGINRIHLPTGQTRFFTKSDGLPDDNVVGILSEGDNLWISTYNGLSSFDKSKETFQNFFEEDGLSHNEFNYASAFKDRQGNMYFGGMNGVNAFHPDDILEQDLNPPLVLTGFTKYNHRTGHLYELLPSEIETPVVLSPYISYFQFDWTLPIYFQSDKNQYWTWLEGLEEDWSYLGNSPSLRFNGLSPGRYTLHLRGADSRGNPAAGELSIPIEVRPIFYQRPWFILLSVALLTGVVFAFSRYRYKRRLELERMRTKIASDLHDEVGSMLSGLAMQAEILELQNQVGSASTLTYLKEVSRSAVAKMRDMVWSIDSRRDSVDDLLDRMREHADETFPARDISCEIKTQGFKAGQRLPVNVRQQLYLIFKEAVTNICKHSDGDRVDVFIGNKDGNFEMSIADNGSFIKEKKTSTGLGLSNMHLRAKAIKADLSIQSQNGYLVKVTMNKPL